MADCLKEVEVKREQYNAMKLENQNIKVMANDYINKFCYADMMLSQQGSQLETMGMQCVTLSADLRYKEVNYKLMQESSDYKD